MRPCVKLRKLELRLIEAAACYLWDGLPGGEAWTFGTCPHEWDRNEQGVERT